MRNRNRTFTHAPADLPREDPLVQQVIGRAAGAAYAARTLVLDIADQLDRLLATGGQDEELLDRVEFDVA